MIKKAQFSLYICFSPDFKCKEIKCHSFSSGVKIAWISLLRKFSETKRFNFNPSRTKNKSFIKLRQRVTFMVKNIIKMRKILLKYEITFIIQENRGEAHLICNLRDAKLIIF